MNNLWLALEGASQVLLAGLLLGAGLPAIFSLGIRALSYGAHQNVDDHTPHPLAKVVAGFAFGIVIVAVVLGISVIVSHGMGYRLSFDNIYPMFVPK
ncbi:hypothetical protein [Tessaracoccus sp. MC1756]|uniref:hypothetical protein n=1 Tax=Tessaracoccus sp. MC1756 TaxID=2760311 RepID=UPI0016017C6B|nr:hypothetical protein [Tessaracoccus sp. MC1756]MBB1510137.1 hypothetical protein [Tessaracoccus sp. MC1756]